MAHSKQKYLGILIRRNLKRHNVPAHRACRKSHLLSDLMLRARKYNSEKRLRRMPPPEQPN
jgi:hypothetical protein